MGKKRGRPKGTKARVDRTIEKIVGTPNAVVTEPKKKDITFNIPAHSTDGDPLESNRIDMYEAYAKQQEDANSTGIPVPDLELKGENVASDVTEGTTKEVEKEEPSQEDVKQEVEKEVLEEKIALRDDREDVVKAEEELAKTTEERKKIITEPPAEEVVKQKDGISENEFIKTVPYDALFAEREKRKELKRQNDALLLKLAEAEKIKDLSKDEIPVDVEDDIITKIQLDKVRQEVKTIQDRFQQDEQQQRINQFNSDVDKVDSELTQVGYPGFKVMGQYVIADKIAELRLQDPDIASAYQNIGGWKKLYIEAFPSVKAMFVQQAKEETFAKKTVLKSQANLVGSHGKADVIEKKPEELSSQEQYKNYLKMRGEKAL